MSVIEIEGLRKSYGDKPVLDGVNLSIEPGVFALLGPNGAGKTTTVHILSTLVRPDAGTAVIAGHDIHRNPAGVRSKISLTGQFAAIDPLLSGRENLTLMARLARLPRRAVASRVDELLDRFDLADAADKRAGSYSGGMRRRLDIAVSLLVPPSVLFLDEPTTGLDPRSRQGVWELVRELVADGVSIFLTTQYLEEADELADRIAVLHDGAIAADGTAGELKRRFGTDVVVAEFADGQVSSIPTDGTPADAARILTELTASPAPVVSFELRKPTLDDVFLALTAQGPAGTLAAAQNNVDQNNLEGEAA